MPPRSPGPLPASHLLRRQVLVASSAERGRVGDQPFRPGADIEEPEAGQRVGAVLAAQEGDPVPGGGDRERSRHAQGEPAGPRLLPGEAFGHQECGVETPAFGPGEETPPHLLQNVSVTRYNVRMSRYRLAPTAAQQAALRGHCAHARYVWNLAVEQESWWRPGRRCAPGYLEQCRQLTQARAHHPWLRGGQPDGAAGGAAGLLPGDGRLLWRHPPPPGLAQSRAQ